MAERQCPHEGRPPLEHVGRRSTWELLRVALRQFAERGFDGTTIADIASATGTAHGLVCHYFSRNNELLLAVLERFRFLHELRAILDFSPEREAVGVLRRGRDPLLSRA